MTVRRELGGLTAVCVSQQQPPERRMQKTVAGSGYSGTPLAKKLGIKSGSRVLCLAVPENYLSLLEPLPAGVTFPKRASRTIDIAHLFALQKARLLADLELLRATLSPTAAIWVSWPKKVSKVETDITEDTIRGVALPLGLVDVKVCAINETWSGLKRVVRKELR